MHVRRLLATALWTGSALGAAVHRLTLHESRDAVPERWKKQSTAPPANMAFPVRIAIRSNNLEAGHEKLMDVADPDSPNFGKHWTAKEVRDFFSPSKEAVDAVRRWLIQSGIEASRHALPQSRGHISFRATVNEVEALLGAQYDVYEDEKGDRTLSCEQYHVPEHLQHEIDFVSPTIGFNERNFPALQKPPAKAALRRRSSESKEPLQGVSSRPLPPCTEFMSPACVREHFNLQENQEKVPGNDLGIVFPGPSWSQEDLDEYFLNFYPRIPQGTQPKVNSIDGGTALVPIENWEGGYSEVDLPILFPLVYPQGIQAYQVFALADFAGNAGYYDGFLDALDARFCTYKGGDNSTYDPTFPSPSWPHPEMCGTYKPTNVVVLPQFMSEAFLSPAYERRQCEEFMKLSLQGTTFITYTDDAGTVTNYYRAGCLSGNRYNPAYPATCPYVTVVGATQKVPGADLDGPEQAAANGASSSGGGFSNTFPRPSWQADAVDSFLKLPASGDHTRFNTTGRAYPDLSLLGYRFGMFFDGILLDPHTPSAVAGSIFSGLVSRMVGERIKAGKGPVGFLNPTLYKNADAFTDITVGGNLDCDRKPAFSTAEGWDPVTGLGTLKYDELLDMFMSLP